VQVLAGKEFALPPRCASAGGYNLHAGVVVAARNRRGLERLCRYVARPPLAGPRLRRLPDGDVEYEMKRRWSDGTEAIRFTPLELCEKLTALVPRPRKNQVTYYGVLAANASWRAEVVPRPRTERAHRHRTLSRESEDRPASSRWIAWATLLKRIFDVDGFRCNGCGGPMRLRAMIEDPPLATRIIEALEGAARAPPPEPLTLN
jgi:hypothetical protein